MKQVKMSTSLEGPGVLYEVRVGRKVVWSKKVLFGRQRATRAGGVAFQAAAREQERVAWEHVELEKAGQNRP